MNDGFRPLRKGLENQGRPVYLPPVPFPGDSHVEGEVVAMTGPDHIDIIPRDASQGS